jgi:hypothetical protein
MSDLLMVLLIAAAFAGAGRVYLRLHSADPSSGVTR